MFLKRAEQVWVWKISNSKKANKYEVRNQMILKSHQTIHGGWGRRLKEYNIHSSCKYVFETRYQHHFVHLAQLNVHNTSIKSELLVGVSILQICLSRIYSQNLG